MLLGRLALSLVLTSLMAPALAAQTSGEGSTGSISGPSAIGNKGDGHLELQLGYYSNDDGPGNGNPFLDESLTVIEPVIVYDYNVTDRLQMGGILSYDNISSASIDRLSKYPEQSGASGDNYIGADLFLRYQTDPYWTYGGHAGFSTEYDYSSIGLGFNATQKLKDADATMSYSLDAYFDSLDLIRYNGIEEGSDSRTSFSGTVSWYQILSPTSHGSFGITLAQQNGFLSTPYNAVVAEGEPWPGGSNPNLDNGADGTEATEVLPDSRSRVAVFGRIRNSISKGKAYELGGRLYSDSWGISSLTFEPRYYFSVNEKLDWRLRYRLYVQTEADDFQDHFSEDLANLPEFRTQDSDLGAFDAHTFGTKWTWYSDPDVSYNLSLDYTLRSDGLDQVFGSVGWNWSF